MKSDKKIYAAVKAVGPEIMTTANASDPIKGAIGSSFLGEAVTAMVLRDLSDANPHLVNKQGFANYSKFYPSGSCF